MLETSNSAEKGVVLPIYPAEEKRRLDTKDDGSNRMLGIPTVIDRLIQQAISQVLIELYDGVFSENSFGFRPGRNAHQAVERAKSYIESGYEYVVDLLNESKSGVRRPEEIKLLGYSFYLNKKGKWVIRISNKSKKKFNEKMAIITNRHRAGSIETIINELVPKLRGWGNYFKQAKLTNRRPDRCTHGGVRGRRGNPPPT